MKVPKRGGKAGKTGTEAGDTWTHKVRKAREPRKVEGEYRVAAVRRGDGEGSERVYAVKGSPSTLLAGVNLWDGVRARLRESGTKTTNEARRKLTLHVQAYRRAK